MRRRGPSGASKLPITVKEKTLDKVRAAYEKAGVAFIDEDGGGFRSPAAGGREDSEVSLIFCAMTIVKN